jgi:F5/8 type C domain/Glycosyl hydrolases family 2, sugar binding domain
VTTRTETHAQTHVISLAGSWRCRLDEEDVGLAQHWYVAGLDGDADLKIDLPGTTDEAALGTPLALTPVLTKPVLQYLHRTHRFVGPVWYQTELDIPADAVPGRTRWSLELERVLWESRAWIDGVPLGRRDSLSVPHHFDLPADLRPGTHRLTVRVDNRPVCDVGKPHAYSEETQPIWNGIVGALRLRPIGSARFDRLRVTPVVDARRLAIQCTVLTPVPTTLDVTVVSPDGQLTVCDSRVVDVTPRLDGMPQSMTIDLDVELGEDVTLWDEFTPALYDVCVALRTDDESAESDVRELRIGLRSFATRGNVLLVNERPTFLRGTLECCIFPNTGYPPCDVPPWRRMMQIVKSYGLNHIRFHSYCPPEAAFQAADEAGIYLQVELPHWTFKPIDASSATIAYLEAEGRRILDAYANHASFVLLSLGNELPGDFDALDELVRRLRAHDPRPLYTATSYSFAPRGRWPGPEDDVYITQQSKLGWTRGQGFFNNECPTTDRDFNASVEGIPTPVITHEVGQYTIYPNLSEISQYEGTLRPLNLEAIQNDVAQKGLAERVPHFTNASGRWAAELYREDIERALRTEGLSGIQLLDLHDFPGQGTAMVGLLDAFWRSKGIVEPEWFASFCRPTALLLRMPKRAYTTDETLEARVQIAHFGPLPIQAGTNIDWSLRDDAGGVLSQGSIRLASSVNAGDRPIVGAINVSLSTFDRAQRVSLRLSLPQHELSSEWNMWVYPAHTRSESTNTQSDDAKAPDVLVRRALDSQTVRDLAAGARVLLTPHPTAMNHRVRGQFVPVFWSPVHFPMQPGTQGLLIDSKHPALADFPTDRHTDWQWWELTRTSTAMAIDAAQPRVTPIVQFIDNFARNSTPAAVFEVAVGKGKLLVCTLDITSDLKARPVARQLRDSLIAYAASDRFRPSVTWSAQQLTQMFCDPSRMAGARIVEASSHQPGCDPEFAIDGEPNSFWHSDWSAGHQYPHHVTIDLGATRSLDGVRLMPRQDGQKSGLIDRFGIDLSEDGSTWERVAESRFDGAKEQLVEFPARYVGNRLVGGSRVARFVRVVAESGQDGTPHATLAEVCVVEATS